MPLIEVRDEGMIYRLNDSLSSLGKMVKTDNVRSADLKLNFYTKNR